MKKGKEPIRYVVNMHKYVIPPKFLDELKFLESNARALARYFSLWTATWG